MECLVYLDYLSLQRFFEFWLILRYFLVFISIMNVIFIVFSRWLLLVQKIAIDFHELILHLAAYIELSCILIPLVRVGTVSSINSVNFILYFPTLTLSGVFLFVCLFPFSKLPQSIGQTSISGNCGQPWLVPNLKENVCDPLPLNLIFSVKKYLFYKYKPHQVYKVPL